jgi:hypothetical protein
MSWIRFLSATLLVVVGTPAGAVDVPDKAIAGSNWRGILTVSEERLLVDVEVVSVGDLELTIGSVKSEEGVNMAFLVPSSAKGLITSTWASPSEVDTPLILWSDGNCVLLESRAGKESPQMAEVAPWLGWTVSSIDVKLLAAAAREGTPSWVAATMLSATEGFYPNESDDVNAVGALLWHPQKAAGEPPSQLLDHWEAVSLRFMETRDRLRRIGSLIRSSQVER